MDKRKDLQAFCNSPRCIKSVNDNVSYHHMFDKYFAFFSVYAQWGILKSFIKTITALIP